MLFWMLPATFAQPISLKGALDQAMSSNLEIQQARLDLERAERYVSQVRGGFDPSLSMGLDRSSSSSPSNDTDDGTGVVTSTSSGWTVNASQPLPTGGSVGLGWSESVSESDSASQVSSTWTADSAWLSVSQPLLDGAWYSARYGVRAAVLAYSDQQLSYRASVEQLTLDVSAAYWGLVAAREQLRLAQRSVEIAEEQFADTQERLEEGFAGSGEVLQIQRAMGTAQQAAVVAEASAASAAADLARLLALPLESAASLEPTDQPTWSDDEISLTVSLERARARNAGWLRAQLDAQGAEMAFRDARIDALPSLGVSGSLGLSGGGDSATASRQQIFDQTNPSWSVGTDLSLDLPAREARADLARSRMSVEQARLELQADEQDLILSVQSAIWSVERDRSRVELAEQTLEAARLALEADQELHREGNATTREVILSLEAMNEAQVSMLEAQIDLQASTLELKRVEGELLGTLGLQL